MCVGSIDCIYSWCVGVIACSSVAVCCRWVHGVIAGALTWLLFCHVLTLSIFDVVVIGCCSCLVLPNYVVDSCACYVIMCVLLSIGCMCRVMLCCVV